jgi:ferrous iron transport protein A
MPLAMARPGEVVTLVAINAGFGLRRRLADMGLSPGVSLRVIQSQMPGPVIIELRGSRLALGRGMAQKIMVKGM